LKIQTVDKPALEKLRTFKRGKKAFVDIANFDVLENPLYIEKFFYQPMDRRFENLSSDFVTRALYMGDKEQKVPKKTKKKTSFPLDIESHRQVKKTELKK
jgi:hypothetical protein